MSKLGALRMQSNVKGYRWGGAREVPSQGPLFLVFLSQATVSCQHHLV